MNHIQKIIELAEHPERFTEEQMSELLADEESLKMYLTVSETMMALDTDKPHSAPIVTLDKKDSASTSRHEKKPPRIITPRIIYWAAAACAAALIGITGIKLQEKPTTLAQADITQAPGTPSRAPEPSITREPETPDTRDPGIPPRIPETPDTRDPGHPDTRNPAPEPQAPATPEPEIDVDNIISIQQARIDNEIATAAADIYIAQHYAMQVANLEEPSLPATAVYLGDESTPEASIMTLIMQ